METGQEDAAELRRFLEELNHPALVVNLDPANIILYNKGNPIQAAEIRMNGYLFKYIHLANILSGPVNHCTQVYRGQCQDQDLLRFAFYFYFFYLLMLE